MEPINESWSHFGEHLKEFLLDNEKGLVEDDFDLIIGFSRGGVILSNILSCLIKDKCEHYKENLHKLSLRNIPNGIYAKSDDSCFLINKTATLAELDDIHKYLENDLKIFYSEYCEKEQKQLNILVVDDNLTGSTRIFGAKSVLKELDFVGTVKTLAYTRVIDFKVPKLDYQIREYPPKALFFIMPWHHVHIEPQHPIFLDKTAKTNLVFTFECDCKINFNKIINDIEQAVPYCQIDKHDDEDFDIKDCVNFRIGTSDLGLHNNKVQNTLDLYCLINKIYPPKACLNGNEIFENNLCKNEKSTDLCTLCTTLNCNTDFFKILFNNGGFSKIKIEYLYEDLISKSVLNSVNLWFLKNKLKFGF